MTNPDESVELYVMSPAKKKTVIADYTNEILYSGETLASVTSVTQIDGPGTLTLGSGTVNGSAVTVGSRTVAISKGVQFTVDARSQPPGKYYVRVIAVSSNGDILPKDCRIEVRA